MIPPIPEDRPLTTEEQMLVGWMLAHGGEEAARHLPELDTARVVQRCGCGCASVDFSVDGQEPPESAPLRVVADFQYRDENGRVAAASVFVRAGRLAGIELSCLDPEARIDRLPAPEVLRPFTDPSVT